MDDEHSMPLNNILVQWHWTMALNNGIEQFVRSSIHPFFRSSTHQFMHLFIHLLIHSSTHPLIHAFTHPFIHSSLIHSSIHLSSINSSSIYGIPEVLVVLAGSRSPSSQVVLVGCTIVIHPSYQTKLLWLFSLMNWLKWLILVISTKFTLTV